MIHCLNKESPNECKTVNTLIRSYVESVRALKCNQQLLEPKYKMVLEVRSTIPWLNQVQRAFYLKKKIVL